MVPAEQAETEGTKQNNGVINANCCTKWSRQAPRQITKFRHYLQGYLPWEGKEGVQNIQSF